MKLHYSKISNSILNIKPDKRNECFNFGLDNAYPSLVEALISMSVTSKNCVDRSSKAIYGAGFGESGKTIVNSKEQKLNEVLRLAARQYAKQNNAYLHITYDGNYDIKSINVVPTTDVRVGKADDRGYSGKFIVYHNWDKSKGRRINPNDFQLYDKFNPDKEVIEGQVKKAGGLQKYNGQILHLRKDDTYIYSLSDLHTVMPEALLEYNSETFRSNGAEKGFLNTKIMVVQPFKDEDSRKGFKKDLNELRGAENSSDVLLLETSQTTDDVTKQMNLQDLSGEYNDKLFEYSDKQSEKNICKAFTVPLMLVSQTDNSLFGSSGEMLKEAKIQLWESREEERLQFEEVFSNLMSLFQDNKKIETPLVIENPYIDKEEEIENKNINKQAQAQLRGTAAGVQGIIDLTKAVKENSMDKENAVEIIKSIYGFSDKKAKAMIGGFEDELNKDK